MDELELEEAKAELLASGMAATLQAMLDNPALSARLELVLDGYGITIDDARRVLDAINAEPLT